MSLAHRLVLGTLAIVLLAMAVRAFTDSIPFAAFLAIVVTLVAGHFGARSIARRVEELGAAARAIASGQPAHFAPSTIPEFASLTMALRQMQRTLDERFAAVQQSQSAGAAIVDAMSDGLIATDARGTIVVMNAAARELLAYDPHEALPDVRSLFRAKAAREAVEEVLAGHDVHDREAQIDDRLLVLNGRALAEGRAVLILSDLTELRRLEQVRRDFVANVSHELKTPLTSISGYAETLATGDVDDATRDRFLRTIHDNARRMQSLVDDLLELSKVESGRWQPRREQVALDAAIDEAWGLLAERAAKGGVSLHRDLAGDAGQVFADPRALDLVLGNLLDNAIRHVPRGGTITVASRRGPDGVEVAVIDTGSGIPAEHLPRIFERFYRVDPSRSREQGGTGLGLAIVRHVMEAHGGQVTAESTVRQGTTIRLRFSDQPAS